MAATDEYIQVTREKFQAFLERYPREKLEHDCVTIAEPPIHNYCDWSKVVSPIGTGEAHMEARQAYCIYDDRGGEDRFFVRSS